MVKLTSHEFKNLNQFITFQNFKLEGIASINRTGKQFSMQKRLRNLKDASVLHQKE